MEDINFILFKESELKGEIPVEMVSVFDSNLHYLARLASEKLQDYISLRALKDANFRLNHGNETKKIGKMFGVLVAENKEGKIGYLQAFSGKLGSSNHHETFVPPVFDLLDPENFFNQGMTEITVLTNEINEFKDKKEFVEAREKAESESKIIKAEIKQISVKKAKLKQQRKVKRLEAKSELSEFDFQKLEAELAKDSIENKNRFKKIETELKKKLAQSSTKYREYSDVLDELVRFRKRKSSKLQQQLFDEYKFVNSNKEAKLLRSIFNDPKGFKMPAGAGECSAPKLFQYAFLNEYKPIALAEFWWGKSPKSEGKVHKEFYPPCEDKCVPILGFMLK